MRASTEATLRPRLIGLRASVSPGRAFTTKIDDHRGQQADGHHGEREDQALGGVRADEADGPERR